MTENIPSTFKKELKTRGRALPAAVQIGKNGLTDAITQRISQMLESQELVKLKVLNACPLGVEEVAHQLSDSLDALLIGVTGSTILIYKPAD